MSLFMKEGGLNINLNLIQGSQQNLETWTTWRLEFYPSRSRNNMEFVQKSEKTKTKQEI